MFDAGEASSNMCGRTVGTSPSAELRATGGFAARGLHFDL
jgi:hypothetical protein